jgi:GLPGLI family protein
MNMYFRKSLLTLGILSLSLIAGAQKKKKETAASSTGFEGTIVYTIELNSDGLPPETKQMFAGSEMTVTMKGDKSRTDLKMGPQATTAVADAKAKTSFTLLDIMGQKYKVVTKVDEKPANLTIKELPETKEIAGYTCKKAEVTSPASPDPITVYYTEKIGNNGYNTQIKGIKGYPLAFEINQSGVKISYNAKSVSTEKVMDSKFDVDCTGYKEITQEELMKSMGGGQ